ncbi:hypothetical protein [Providencia rettgeri]|uniref:YARHG domain-containing protein n=1 Tax=Providencia rettgeri TaxID=587 RepID=A0AAW6UJA7_PRORE|nr:hypothetical protein [Providencia rettgeri]MDI9093598.1 hypothetical protein [Providencia rettgeri]
MRNILFLIALFSGFSVAGENTTQKQEFWYEGCPKYTDEQLDQLKGSKVVSTEELRTYSKKQLEDFVSKNECDVINLNERKKYLLKKLKKMDESVNK